MSLLISAVNRVEIAHGEREISDKVSDEVLVSMAKSGDSGAFVELSKRHSNKSFQAAYRITRNRQDAEDALQDSFLKAFIHIKTFQERSSFSTWLTRITTNSALMILRKRATRFAVSLDGCDTNAETCSILEPRSPMEDPESLYVRNEGQRLLREAIRRLPAAFQDVVHLQKTRELSMQEIAQSLGISVSAAKSRLARARRALRTSIPHTLSTRA